MTRRTANTVTFDFQEHKLPNGLLILALRDTSLPVVSFQMHFAAGSRNERPGITGISHLFEHMMFRGSKELGPEEFSKIIQANGGYTNAFTTTDNTSYYENLPAAKLELAIRLEAERLENLRITEENLTTEREVVRSERKYRTVNSPFGLVMEQLFATAYTIHPYRWPVVGWDQDLRELTLDDCLEYYRTYYASNRAVAVMVGDVKPDHGFTLVEKHFGHLPSQPEPAPIRAGELPQRGERRTVYKKVAQTSALFAGFHIPGIAENDIFPLLVLASILSSGRSARFYRKFIKTGRAVEAEADLGSPPFLSMDPGLMVISVAASPGGSINALEQDVWKETDALKTHPIEVDELEKSKKKLRSSFLMSLQTHFYKGIVAGVYRIRAGDHRWINRIESAYQAVKAEDVMEVARRYLNEDNRSVVHLVPVSSQEGDKWGDYE
jgi:predicted Zn-dependent peptidase